MNAPSSLRSPSARLYQPSVDVAPFVRAFMLRDTRQCALQGEQLLNRFPASAHCVMTWFLEGEAELLSDTGGQQGLVLSGCVISGCQTQPVVSRNRGDTHGFMAMFYPDAFQSLFGADLAALQNKFVDAHAVLPARGRELADAVFAAASHSARQVLVEDCIREHAQRHKLPAWLRLRRMGSRISLGMAASLLGIGPRQLQRLALRELGTSLQTLNRLRRGERSFLAAQRRHLAGQPHDWAEHALDCDYADQSHLTRDCKAQTGRTPAQLARDVMREEADWVYRLEFADEFTDDDHPPPARSA
ncbi:helix-turn-helix domain-containing protein [Massilia aerilata]|uniref:Helix-turn-helix domain-containing protein n=1 Tax=Massilia aerilata TaxID=453817 RepID=A0ABW0S327_9BURK